MVSLDQKTHAKCAAWRLKSRGPLRRVCCFGLLVLSMGLLSSSAHATDEIQVYNAEIAQIGQWTIQQHLNYTFRGQTQPDFPGALVSNHGT
jgi:hypothetical protein